MFSRVEKVGTLTKLEEVWGLQRLSGSLATAKNRLNAELSGWLSGWLSGCRGAPRRTRRRTADFGLILDNQESNRQSKPCRFLDRVLGCAVWHYFAGFSRFMRPQGVFRMEFQGSR